MSQSHDSLPLNLMLDDIVSAVGQIIVTYWDARFDQLQELNGEESAKQKVDRVKRQLDHAKTSLAAIKASNARKKHLNALANHKRKSVTESVSEGRGVDQIIVSTSGKVLARVSQLDPRTVIYKNAVGGYVGRYVKGTGTFDQNGRRVSKEDVGLMLIGLQCHQNGRN